MDNLSEDRLFLISYETKEGKIIETYADGSRNENIPNTPHNIEACDRKLERQYQENFKPEVLKYKNLVVSNAITIGALSIIEVGAICSQAVLGTALGVAFILRDLNEIRKARKKLKRLRLTDYCLTHAMSLKFSEEGRDASYGLSENGVKAFKLDRGFKLNHAHLYTNKDLKQLKKVIGE